MHWRWAAHTDATIDKPGEGKQESSTQRVCAWV